MAVPSDKNILTDADGMPIPQIWDPITEDFVPYEGKVKVDGQVSVSDRTVNIGGTNYRMIDSNTLVGLAANQPTAAAAASAIGIGVMYWSIDTDTIEVSTGSLWKVVI